MSTLYMMRHGQTLFNKLRRKQGACDSPLTELGIDQARAAGTWFREHGIAFDHAYSSTQERASDTLELVVPGMPYERVKGIKERSFGVFEGLTEDTNIKPPYRDFYVQFGGEGDTEFGERLMASYLDIMNRPGHESVLAVSHGAACAQMLRMCGYELLEHGAHLGNCGICILDFDRAPQAFTVREVINPNE